MLLGTHLAGGNGGGGGDRGGGGRGGDGGGPAGAAIGQWIVGGSVRYRKQCSGTVNSTITLLFRLKNK